MQGEELMSSTLRRGLKAVPVPAPVPAPLPAPALVSPYHLVKHWYAHAMAQVTVKQL